MRVLVQQSMGGAAVHTNHAEAVAAWLTPWSSWLIKVSLRCQGAVEVGTSRLRGSRMSQTEQCIGGCSVPTEAAVMYFRHDRIDAAGGVGSGSRGMEPCKVASGAN
jgi:hypothetical protein